jgi:hypothetical protein
MEPYSTPPDVFIEWDFTFAFSVPTHPSSEPGNAGSLAAVINSCYLTTIFNCGGKIGSW